MKINENISTGQSKSYRSSRAKPYGPRPDRFKIVKEHFTIPQIAEEFGDLIPREGRAFRAFHRPDKNPSCVYYQGRIKDFATDESFDVVDYFALRAGVSQSEAVGELYRRVSGDRFAAVQASRRTLAPERDKRALETANEEKAAKRKLWPTFGPFPPAMLSLIGMQRGFYVEALEIPARQGLLQRADYYGGPNTCILANLERTIAQARQLNGKPWGPFHGGVKALTLPGSIAGDPICGNINPGQALAICEGGPDFLAAYHHAYATGIEDLVCPVGLMGAAVRISEAGLAKLAGRRARIFLHDDEAGQRAFERWGNQLTDVGCTVDGFSFEGLTTLGGAPVQDLADLARISPDSWEANHDIVENCMSFALEGGI